MLFRGLLSGLSPAGAGARLSTLIFHRVLPAPDPLAPGEIDVVAFDQICAWVAAWFQVLPLDQAVERLKRDDLPARARCASPLTTAMPTTTPWRCQSCSAMA